MSKAIERLEQIAARMQEFNHWTQQVAGTWNLHNPVHGTQNREAFKFLKEEAELILSIEELKKREREESEHREQ